MLRLQKKSINGVMLISLICLITILSGCGGGSDDSATETTQTQPAQPVAQSVKVEGKLLGGPVQKASVVITDSKNLQVGTAEIGNSGEYKMTPSADKAVSSSDKTFPLKIEMIGGNNKVCGNDPLAVYRSLVSDKSVTTANIGTLTTLIYDAAVSEAGGLASVTPAIHNAATDKVLKVFGFGISAGIDPIRTPIDSGNAASVIRASQALNEMLMRLGKTPDERNLILTALAEDISDGKSDGKKSEANLRSALPPGISANGLCAATHIQLAAISADVMANMLRLTQNTGNVLTSAETSDCMAEAVSATAPMTKSEASAKLNALTVTENEIGQAVSSLNVWTRLTGKGTLADSLSTALAGVRAGQSAEAVNTALSGISLADLKALADSTSADIFRGIYPDDRLYKAIHNIIGLVSLNVIPADSSVVSGKTVQFKAEGKYSDDTLKDITAQVKWSSSDISLATITADGLATALLPGNVLIQAVLNGITGSAKLKINAEITAPVLVSIQVMPQSASPEAGKTVQFKAIGTYRDGTTQDITAQVKWSSSDTAIATVSATGLSTAVAPGAADIQAELSGITGSAKLTVNTPAPVLVSIQITPQSPSAETGKTTQFKAVGTYKDGSSKDITDQVKWSSSDTAVATINANGLAARVAAGTSVISAELNGVSSTAPLTATAPYYDGGSDTYVPPVVPPVRSLVSVKVLPEEVVTVPGRTQQYAASGTYSDNTKEDITGKAVWSSSAASVATVSNTGLATAVADGKTGITATSDGVSGSANLTVQAVTPPVYKGTETTIPLRRSGPNQILVPVEVGNQTLNLLADTGSKALLVFDKRIAPSNKKVIRDAGPVILTDMRVSKSYSSATRTGVLATAPIRIGAYFAPAMRIMVIDSPDYLSDPSLTAKEADGIIGLRRTEGLTFENDPVQLDAPFSVLQPAVNIFELNLPPTGEATLSLGKMATLDSAKSSYIFKAKTLSFEDPSNPVGHSFSDLQVPFRAKSSFGEANGKDLDVLLDSGAVSKLILDTEVAKSLGYNPLTETWTIPADEEIEFNLTGPNETVTLYPKFKVSEISVAPYRAMGVSFEAVLGIDRWQHYIIGFSYVDWDSGGPDGTLLMLFRPNLSDAKDNAPGQVSNYQDLTGLNSVGDDRYPSADDSGNTVVFQSDRPGGMGGWDIYVWKKGVGISELPGLNSATEDAAPCVTGDGRYLVFHSDRTGGMGNSDIYLYDIVSKTFVPTPGLNSVSSDRNPSISRDGRYIAFRSERAGGAGGSDIYLYDRNTSALVSLPGLNTDKNEYDPVLNQDGSLIAFDYEYTPDGKPLTSDVCLYDVKAKTLNRLPNLNTADSWESDASISPDGKYLSFNTNRLNPAMSMYDRNFMVFNLKTSQFEMFSGLNSAYDEEGLRFTGDSKNVIFHSNRTGGQGGADIFLYSMDAASQNASKEDLPNEDIPLNYNAPSGVFTIQAPSGSGTNLTLLVDTSLNGVILFADKVPAGTACGGAVQVALPGGNLNAAKQICLPQTVRYITGKIPVVNAQAEYNAIVGRTDLPVVDGVIGFRKGYPNSFSPPVKIMEFCFTDGTAMGLDIKPGISLGRMPVIGLANGQGDFLFNSEVTGFTDPVDPYHNSFTDPDMPFIAGTDTGVSSSDGKKIMFSTVLKDQLILDLPTAQSLGYSASAGWGTVKTVSIFFRNSTYTLPTEFAYPVEKVKVADLTAMGCNAVLSADRWIGQFLVGFTYLDYQAGGPSGVISLLNIKDLPAIKGTFYQTGHNYVSLPGMNSMGDDLYPGISADGQTIAFQSNRDGGTGGNDVYVYRIGLGLLNLPGLNSSGDDGTPTISADGNLVAFQSDRTGNYDIYLYNISTKSFVDLPGLNTQYLERQPGISGDGTMLAFRSERPESIDGSSDIYLYSIAQKAMVPLYSTSLNSSGGEYAPFLNKDGTLLVFYGENRADSKGKSDVYLYDLTAGRLIDLPDKINTEFSEDGTLSFDGNFMGISSYRDGNGNIYLLDRKSGEFIYLPGLNTPSDDSASSVSTNARYIAFNSDRSGGQGGYDIYLYKRDDTDNTVYTVTETYTQKGYVAGTDGNKIPAAQVSAYDKTGKLIGTATADSSGNFNLIVPPGTQLPVTYATAAGKVVTDDIGDDTYVPDFTAGNLKFTQVWIEDKAQAGFPTTIRFDVETTTPVNDTYIKVYLKKGNPSEIQLNGGIGFTPDYDLTALIIDKLGQKGKDAAEVVRTQGDIVTKVTYLPGTENRKARVEHTFIVPSGIADGTYTAVFSINMLDINPADNAIQGETSADQSDNYMIASAATIIGNPDKPNLRILSASLVTNSFELPEAEDAQNSDDIDSVSGRSALTLNMEVESMAQDTVKPTDIIFELVIDGSRYPLWFEGQNDAGAMIKRNIFTYAAACRPEDRPGYPEGQRCASLFRQEQTGRTYKLYLSQAAYDILKTRTSDTPCQVVIKVDPNNTIEEWENNKADNVKNLSVMYLAPQVPLRSLRAKYPSVIFDTKKLGDKFGSKDWNGGYSIADSMSYRVTNFGSIGIPTAGDIDLMGNEVYVTYFGIKHSVFKAGAKCSIDIDNIPSTGGEYVLTVLEKKIFSGSKYLNKPSGACDNECSECKKNCTDDKCKADCGKRFEKGEIWNSKDLAGNEKWSMSPKLPEVKQTFVLGPVPVTIAAKGTGEVGLRASLKIADNNKVILEGGPYASLTAEASGGLGAILILGIECKVTLIECSFGVNIGVQILPSYPLAIIRVSLPLTLKAIEGKLSAFLKVDGLFWPAKVIGKKEIFKWDPVLEKTWYPIMDPKSLAFGADTFKGWYSTSSDFIGSTPFTENALYHDWGNKGPSGLSKTDNFFARWEGYFDIDAGLMNFCTETDDGMEVSVDWNDDEKFSKDEKVIDHADAPWTGIVSKEVSGADAGYHKIRVDYNEKTGNAKAKFYWVKDNEYAAWYWNNTDLSGDPVLFRRENSIDYNWGTGSPYGDKDKNVVNPDNFSVRWEGNIDFPIDGSYTVIANGDKGTVSVWVEDQLKATGSSFYVTKGKHKIKAEYKHFTGNAKVNVGFAPKGKFLARYFKNTDRTGTSAKTAIEDKIDYTWGTSGAIAGVKDNFSAIWEGYFSFENGNYDFIAHVNDRMWIWIDGEQIYADRLDGAKSKAFLVTRKMTAGDHHIRVEYTEYDGDATARLNWSKQKDNEFTATYYDGNPTGISDPDASPTRIEKISSIAYNPQGYQSFSVSYEGWAEFDNGIYKFLLTTVGNLWIDNVLTIDQGTKMILPINKGRHLIRLEVAVNGYNPQINLGWSKVKDRNGLVGMAFANQNLSGTSCQDDLYYWMKPYDDKYPIYFYHYIPDGWYGGGASCLKSSDLSSNFSVRLFGVFSVQKDATYYFMAQADDMRIWVDGQPLIKDWDGKQTGASFAEIKLLTQGDHLIKVEYRNLGVSPPTSPAVRIGWNTDGWACIYKNPNFGGETLCFSKDISGAKFEPDLTGSDWNDRISSVKVSGNITFTGFNKFGYQGESIIIKGPNEKSSLGTMDNRISSFRIE